MILKLEDPRAISDAISIISEIVTEVRIKLLEDGLSIVAVDPANVAMVIFKAPKESFAEYIAGNNVWGVNLADLKKILKRASQNSMLTFEEIEGKLRITILDKVKRTFNLALIEVSSEDKDIPDLQFTAKIEMDAIDFSQSIEDASIVADSCTLEKTENIFSVIGSSSLNSAKAEFSSSDIEMFGTAKSKYSLEYINKFIKASKISSRVVVNLSDNYPLRLDFPGEKMGMGFILAPRVEND